MCGCNKNKGLARSGPAMKPSSVRSVSGGIAAGPTPTQLRSQSVQPQQPSTTAAGLSAERRKTQAIRRDAIRRALNK